jgi:hypothetical protein
MMVTFGPKSGAFFAVALSDAVFWAEAAVVDTPPPISTAPSRKMGQAHRADTKVLINISK